MNVVKYNIEIKLFIIFRHFKLANPCHTEGKSAFYDGLKRRVQHTFVMSCSKDSLLKNRRVQTSKSV